MAEPVIGGDLGSRSLVLASTSPYRRALLSRLGLPFRCRSPVCDEAALQVRLADPVVLAETLAREKAESVARVEPGSVVIGGDQVVDCEGRILGKPGTFERAVDQLSRLQGRAHRLVTAMAVWSEGRMIRHTDLTTLVMRPLTRAAIERYVTADQPLDCAGAYKLESRGIALFERIETEDHTAVTGLPLVALASILIRLGFELP